jgi:hypothetical protein
MNTKDILSIELGAKQIPLFFEKDPVDEEKALGSCVREYAERFGEVELHRFIQYMEEAGGDSTVGEILQNVFWMASDHEIEFRSNDKNIAPHEAKKILLESPDAEVFIAFHQPVEDVVLEEVQDFYAQLNERQEPFALPDPHDLSRLLAKQIRYWEDCLNSCLQRAKNTCYPGKKAISDGLSLTKKVSLKLDPFSLIHAFHANRKEIHKLAEDVKTLYAFYTRHTKKWDALINSVDAFDGELAEIDSIPDVAQNLEHLKHILSLEWPFDRLEEANHLVDSITPRHRQIIEKKTATRRREALSQVEHLIENISRTTGKNRTEQDLRRQVLQDLRTTATQINLTRDISAISRLTGEAEDLNDEFMEEIQGIST